jgi:hypothetical protein
MSPDLRDQLDEYFTYIEEIQPSVDPRSVVGSARGDAARGRAPWIMVVAAAVVVLLAVWISTLTGWDTDSDPLTLVTTQDAESNDTPQVAPPIPPSSSATTAAAVPAPFVPPLTFAEVDFPGPGGLGETAWFNGKLYAATWQGQLLSTEDGVNWVNEDLPIVDANGVETLHLSTDGESLVVGGMPPANAIGSESCSEPGDVVTVQVLDQTGVWTLSEIELPFTKPASLAGCLTFWLSDVQVGPDGFIVAGSISGMVPFEAIIAQELGQQVLDEINGMSPEGNVLVVESGDGARTDRIDLDAIGLADDIADFGAYAKSIIESDEGDATWFGERPFVWWSLDGLTWSLVDRTGPPMQDHQIQDVTPTEHGFILTSDFGQTAQLSDGSLWEPAGPIPEDVRTWRGQPVVVDSNGIRLFNEPQTVLVQPEDIVGRDVELGDLGAIAFERIGTFGSLDLSSQPMHFSLDGSTWETWNPEEFSELDEEARFIAIGDDFVIFEVGLRDPVLFVGSL